MVQFSNKGLKVLAFPCNQFGNEEPGSDIEICSFTKKYNYKGDLTSKIDVNGEHAHPLWVWLNQQIKGVTKYSPGEGIDWNFTKFLIDKNGNVVSREESDTHALHMIPDIEKLLN